MKHFALVLLGVCLMIRLSAQDKQAPFKPALGRPDLPGITKCIRGVQGDLPLYTLNSGKVSQEHDVNTIILDIEKYIDSMHKARSYSDQVLLKQFDPLRHFFLTTTNKTTVATSFLYSGTPYQFCTYNDTALALYIYAVKDGGIYNLGKMTERRITKSALENCLLPSLKALDEFKGNEIKYVGLSVYYGCKDSREGAPAGLAVPYCLTLVARLTDIQQYGAGLITEKGLLANAELYLSDGEGSGELRRVQVNVE